MFDLIMLRGKLLIDKCRLSQITEKRFSPHSDRCQTIFVFLILCRSVERKGKKEKEKKKEKKRRRKKKEKKSK